MRRPSLRALPAALGLTAAAVVAAWISFAVTPAETADPSPSAPAEFDLEEKGSDRAIDLVRFQNPFDATEVFEFPAGTPESEAREVVASTLLERARERRNIAGASPTSRRIGSVTDKASSSATRAAQRRG